MNEKEANLEKYKESLKSAWGYNDYNDWPIKINSVMHLFLKEFAKQCIDDIREIKGNCDLENKLLTEFGNPARLYRLIDPIVFGMKRLGITLNEQRKIILYLLDLINRMKFGSIYNEDGKNIIFSPSQVSNIIYRFNFDNAERKNAIKIQKFCGIMWAYTEAVFFRAHEVTKEIHGPYILDNGNKLIVREYLNLAPNEIWHDIIPFINAQSIKIYTIYDGSISISIDSYNHLFLISGDYISNMISYMILVDDKPADINQLMTFMMDIPKTINASHTWVEQTTWREHANKYLDIYWFRKRPMRLVLGKSPVVEPVVRYNIEHGDFDKRRVHNLTDKEIDRLIKIVI